MTSSTTISAEQIAAQLKALFPDTPNALIARGGTELNGLPGLEAPKGKILNKGRHALSRPNDFQDHYLVDLNGYRTYLRVCTAYPDSGYAAFAVVRGMVLLSDEEDAAALQEHANRYIQYNCQPL